MYLNAGHILFYSSAYLLYSPVMYVIPFRTIYSISLVKAGERESNWITFYSNNDQNVKKNEDTAIEKQDNNDSFLLS